MEIEKIKKLKNGKYTIVFTDGTTMTTYDQVILKNNLLTNKTLTNLQFNHINQQTEYYNIYYKVLKYIQKRLRSEWEIKKYLNRIGAKEADNIILELRKHNFINDDNFTKAFIMDQFHLNNYGPLKIKQELLIHEIDDGIIERYIEIISDEEIKNKLEKLINKKIKTNSRDSKYKLKQKILNDFINKGYEKEMINQMFEKNYIEDNNIINKEYDRVYNKLKNKYAKTQLLYQIRQKLYQRGFTLEEINKIIEEKNM